MNLTEAWNKFINDGKIASYLEYSNIKNNSEVKNANFNSGTDNKGNGYAGK
ncbi:MAG: hypothetical protein IJP26_03375 [Clostridia bacterium]|nr:hypothetical protein [Clostridia bacterium]